MYYAQINTDRIVVAITQTAGPIDSAAMIELADFDQSVLGKHHNAATGEFEEIPVPTPTNPTEWLIDIGPFFDRFGAAKMAVLTSTDASVKAILADLQVRKWIDLHRADVATGLQYVGSVVPAVTEELQTSILTAPVTHVENLALRKVYFS